jgi:hypothetical protein
MLKIYAECDWDTTSTKFKDISYELPVLLLGVCCNQTALVDESGMIRTEPILTDS